MSFIECMRAKVDNEELSSVTEERANKVIDTYEDIVNSRGINMDKASQEELQDIAEKTVESLEEETNFKEFSKLQTIKEQLRAKEQMEDYRNNPGLFQPYGTLGKLIGNISETRSLDQAEAALSFLTIDRGAQSGNVNVDMLRKAKFNEYLGMINKFLQDTDRGFTGVKSDGELSDHYLRVLKGEANPDNEGVKKAVDGMRKMLDTAIHEYKAVGGRAGFVEDYVPHPWMYRENVVQDSKEEFIEFIMPRIDRDKMVDYKTGESIGNNDERLKEILDDVYENISDNGFLGGPPGQNGKKLSEVDPRVLHYKNADAWQDINERYGNGNPFEDHLVAYADRMAKDIAFMKRFGPDSRATKNFIEKKIEQRSIDVGGGAEEIAKTQIRRFREIWNNFEGSNTSLVNRTETNSFANWTAATISATIGSAFQKALFSDSAFRALTAQMSGLPPTKSITGMIKNFSDFTTSEKERLNLARQIGVVSSNYNNVLMNHNRFVGETFAGDAPKWLSDQVLRKSLMTPMTHAGRATWGLEFNAFVGKKFDTNFGELPDALRTTMQRYDINEKEWDMLRKTPLFKSPETGIKLLRHNDIVSDKMVKKTGLSKNRLRELKDKYTTMLFTEGQFATPSTTALAQASLGKNLEPADSFFGKVTQSLGLYKNFAVTLMQTHLARAFAQDNAIDTGKHLFGLLGTTTFMGMLGLQFSELTAGKDPRPIDPTSEEGLNTWMDAVMTGGGLGIFGNVAENVEKDYLGISDVLVGPQIGMLEDSLGVASETMTDPKEGPTKAIEFISDWMPGGNLWYLETAKQRLIFDQLQKQLDPNAYQSFRRTEQRVKDEQSTDYWWEPGDASPNRTIDFSNFVDN